MRNDDDRAGSVVQHGLTDRAEQQPDEPAVAASTDDGQLRPPGGVDQRGARLVTQQQPAHLDVGVLVVPAGQGLGQQPGFPRLDFGRVIRQRQHVPGPVDTGTVQPCRASSGTPRSAASSNANLTAGSLAGDPSTPSSTGPPGSPPPCATRTGQVACAASCPATDPIRRPRNPPTPRSPTTISSAVREASSSTAAAAPV